MNHAYTVSINYYVHGQHDCLVVQRRVVVPRISDICTLAGKHYKVHAVEWVLDDVSSEYGAKVNIVLIEESTWRIALLNLPGWVNPHYPG
jgi:hypothetical protein